MSGYVLNIITIKWALAALYLRVVQKRWQRRLIYWIIGIFTVLKLVPFFLDIFQCGEPIAQNFIDPTKCPIKWNVMGPINYTFAAFNAIVDWVLTIIPLVVIWQLQMPLHQKISACILVALGSSASIVSVVRIFFIGRLRLIGDLSFFANLIVIGYLSSLETSIAMIAIAASAYRPLWHKEKNASSYGSSYLEIKHGRGVPVMGSNVSRGSYGQSAQLASVRTALGDHGRLDSMVDSELGLYKGERHDYDEVELNAAVPGRRRL